MNAKLDIWSGAGAGTEIELTVPGAKIYVGASRSFGLHLFNRKAE